MIIKIINTCLFPQIFRNPRSKIIRYPRNHRCDYRLGHYFLFSNFYGLSPWLLDQVILMCSCKHLSALCFESVFHSCSKHVARSLERPHPHCTGYQENANISLRIPFSRVFQIPKFMDISKVVVLVRDGEMDVFDNYVTYLLSGLHSSVCGT